MNLNMLALTKAKEHGEHTIITSKRLVKYVFSLLGLAPIYFLYQENNPIWMIIVKWLAIGTLSLMASNASFSDAHPQKISSASIASAGIAVILMIVRVVTLT